MKHKPLKSELHHWWPRSLAKLWAAGDGMVSATRPTGEVLRAPPGAFGAISNAHHIRLGGPWNSSFETDFNQADSDVASLVEWLLSLEAPTVGSEIAFLDRIAAQTLPEERLNQLSRVTASLLARSPAIRHAIKIRTEWYRKGFPDPAADKNLIAANQRGLYEAYRRKMVFSGRWAVLFSDGMEFVAGDGFLHNFPASQDGINSGKKLIIPLLPTTAIAYMLPMSMPTEPRLVTCRLDAAEVSTINEFTQIYSAQYLFFRSQQPKLSDAFICGEHRGLRDCAHPWLDELLDHLSQFNLWSEGGTPGMCSRRPFTESAEGNRRLEALLRKARSGQ